MKLDICTVKRLHLFSQHYINSYMSGADQVGRLCGGSENSAPVGSLVVFPNNIHIYSIINFIFISHLEQLKKKIFNICLKQM